MSVVKEEYRKYVGTKEGFNIFHNEVINMPRDHFTDTNLKKIKRLAGYLLLTEGLLPEEGVNYPAIMNCIHQQLSIGNYPENYRDEELEKEYFEFDDIEKQYEDEGRMFRHLMSFCAFFGFIESITKQKKSIVYDKCREYYLSNEEELKSIARNNIVMTNINNNDYIKSLKSIEITKDADYRPTYAIMRYINEISRPVTSFELSILLGRVDDEKKENKIVDRAIRIGKEMPKRMSEQIEFFFDEMEWKENDKLFEYKRSQEPYFKFNVYILLLESLNIIKKNEIDDTYILTNYSETLLQDDVSYLIADLEKLLEDIDNDGKDNAELSELIIQQRNPELLRIASDNPDFYIKMNQRSLDNPVFDKNRKRIRNRLIAELAKIQADYTCEYSNKKTFKNKYGKYYCEAHHIIEFSTENGPDITDNLIVLGPEAHARIHQGNAETVKETYLQLARNGAIKIDRFKRMITYYHCLTKEHIRVLYNKGVISELEREELLELLNDENNNT